MRHVPAALTLPLAQLGDRGFAAPLLKGVGAAILAFAGVAALAGWGVSALAAGTGWLATLLVALGAVAVVVAAFWLVVPAMLALAGLFLDDTAAAVERRHYPGLSEPRGASLPAQAWFNAALGAKVLALNLVLLPLTLLLPPLGAALFWAVAAVALGRGLFEGVAQRRMDVPAARALRRSRTPEVLAVGGVLATMALVPLLNLLVPVYGTAAMTHLLHRGRNGALS